MSNIKNLLLGEKLEFGNYAQIQEYDRQVKIFAGICPVPIWIDDQDGEFYYNCPKCNATHRMHNEFYSICECKQLLIQDNRFGEHGLFCDDM
jgi:hypothetical protein